MTDTLKDRSIKFDTEEDLHFKLAKIGGFAPNPYILFSDVAQILRLLGIAAEVITFANPNYPNLPVLLVFENVENAVEFKLRHL